MKGYEAVVEWYWQGTTDVLGEKPVPVPLCIPQIPSWLACGWTQPSMVTGQQLTVQTRAGEPIAHVKISMACSIHRWPTFFSYAWPVSLLWETCVYIHIDCTETVYELPLLPNNTANATFLHKFGVVWVLTGYLSLGWQPGSDGENVTLETFYSLLFKQEVVAAQLL